MSELQRLELDGANARAMGRSQLDNPFYRTERMPRTTGETLEEYVAKVQAWNTGWFIEDAMRPDHANALLDKLLQRPA